MTPEKRRRLTDECQAALDSRPPREPGYDDDKDDDLDDCIPLGKMVAGIRLGIIKGEPLKVRRSQGTSWAWLEKIEASTSALLDVATKRRNEAAWAATEHDEEWISLLTQHLDDIRRMLVETKGE